MWITHRYDVSVNWALFHHIGVIRLIRPLGGVVIDVQDGDVNLSKEEEKRMFQLTTYISQTCTTEVLLYVPAIRTLHVNILDQSVR